MKIVSCDSSSKKDIPNADSQISIFYSIDSFLSTLFTFLLPGVSEQKMNQLNMIYVTCRERLNYKATLFRTFLNFAVYAHI